MLQILFQFHTLITNYITEPQRSCSITEPYKASGKIVYLNDCPKLLQLIKKDLLNADDSKLLRYSNLGTRNNKNIVCCESPGTLPITTAPTPKNYETLLTAPYCGIDLSDRLVGEGNTQIKEHPWTALLQYIHRKSHQFD